MPARLQFDFNPHPRPQPREPDRPLRILLLGDFSGQSAVERVPLAQRRTHKLDLDSVDGVMQRLQPRLQLGGGDAGPASDIVLDSLDSFHPDSLVATLPLFAALRQTRQQLQDPRRFAEAAAMLVAPPPAAPAPPPSPAGADLLAGLLGGRPAVADTAAPAPVAGFMDSFIRAVIAPHVVPDQAAQQAALLRSVDDAIAAEMRRILHAPAFQALESAWRGVHWLITALELDENLELHLFDVSRDELLADIVAAHGRLTATGLHKALADRWRNVPGGESWSVLAGLYSFGPSDTDIGLLAALGLLACQAGGPLLAAGDIALAGADPAQLAGWQTLRHSEAAPWIGLSAPRLLLRRPYGPRSDPVEAFDFEEFPAEPVHEHLLWGPGSLATALLIGRAFSAKGWAMEPGDEREIADLPAYSFMRDGQSQLQACAEQFLSDSSLQALLDAGLMPLASHRHRNAVTVVRMQSIADPAQALAGFHAS